WNEGYHFSGWGKGVPGQSQQGSAQCQKSVSVIQHPALAYFESVILTTNDQLRAAELIARRKDLFEMIRSSLQIGASSTADSRLRGPVSTISFDASQEIPRPL